MPEATNPLLHLHVFFPDAPSRQILDEWHGLFLHGFITKHTQIINWAIIIMKTKQKQTEFNAKLSKIFKVIYMETNIDSLVLSCLFSWTMRISDKRGSPCTKYEIFFLPNLSMRIMLYVWYVDTYIVSSNTSSLNGFSSEIYAY